MTGKIFTWIAAGLLGVMIILGGAGLARGEERTDLEAEMFDDPDALVQVTALPTPAADAGEAKSVGFSGEVTSAAAAIVSNTTNANTLYTYSVGNIFLDARLPRGSKFFANLEAIYYSQNRITEVGLREMFLDFNLGQTLYLRAGKQVLQWGRCYLWNPTDLINVERPTFIRKIGYREGAYGVKAHVPFGTWLNLYGFLDTGNASETEQTAGSGKIEWLLGNMEMAVSGWGKKGYAPVWGYDFSARAGGVDIMGEVSAKQGERTPSVELQDNQWVLAQDSQKWLTQASVDFSRSFTVGEFKDRLTVILEGFYNSDGYTDNPLADDRVYPFETPLMLGDGSMAMQGTRKALIMGNSLYEAHHFSRYYAAVFTTFSRFLIPDMTLNTNYIHNLVDQSGTLTLGVTYTELQGFSAGLLGITYLGGPDREYTFANEKFTVQLTAGLTF